MTNLVNLAYSVRVIFIIHICIWFFKKNQIFSRFTDFEFDVQKRRLEVKTVRTIITFCYFFSLKNLSKIKGFFFCFVFLAFHFAPLYSSTKIIQSKRQKWIFLNMLVKPRLKLTNYGASFSYHFYELLKRCNYY